MADLALHRIILTHFRNYKKEQVEFCEGLNCLTGKNGMGKTNLLDAIYYLCMCKSRINSLDKYALKHGENFIRLEGLFSRNVQNEKIVGKIIPGKSKVIERNNVPYSKFSEHIGFLPVVIILPDDTVMIKEGSEERRKFMDNTLSQIDSEYLSNLISYNKLLKQRNALLKQSNGVIDYTLLEIYDQQMSRPAQLIHQKRKDFIASFIPLFQRWYKGISQEAEEVGIEYKSQLLDKTYIENVKLNLQKDSYLQRSTSGIHKDDLIFQLSSNPMKRYASQGQLKSFVLSLGLARFEILKLYRKISPILLLDDIFDKLDRNRVSQLLSLLSTKNFGQIFLTDTHESRVKEVIANFTREFRIYKVEEGKVSMIENSG